MTLLNAVLLFFVAMLGGTLNSVAGGGSFFVFPALVFTGVPPIPANATNAVALWPGSIASVGAYRRELGDLNRALLVLLVGTSLIGGVLGALLLLHTPQSVFVNLLPYLLLIATLLFAFSGPATKFLRRMRSPEKSSISLEKSSIPLAGLISISVAQLIIATYGGYFGGGIGILMLASLSLMGMENIHVMNGLKTLLASCINGVAVFTFIFAGAVYWPQALLMVVGAIIGGYGGAYYARMIDQKWIRLLVIVVGVGMTIYFFIRK